MLQGYEFKIVYRKVNRMQHVDFLSRNPINDNLNQENPSSTNNTPTNKAMSDESLTNPVPFATGLTSHQIAESGNESLNCKKFRPHGKLRSKVNFLKPSNVEKQVNLTFISLDWLLSAQESDPFIQNIVNKLKSEEIDENVQNTYEIRSGILYRKIQRHNRTRCLPIVPSSLKWSIVNNVHDSIFRLGYDKTVETLYQHYWFENMSKFVKKFVENCLICKTSKSDSGPCPIQLHPIPKSTVPWHTIHFDATGKLSGKRDSKEYLFVIIDACTKYCLLKHIRNIDSVNTVKAIRESIHLFGPPTRIICDQARCCTSQEFKDFCTSHQIELHFIATGASRANGKVERVMSTLINMLTVAETDKNQTW